MRLRLKGSRFLVESFLLVILLVIPQWTWAAGESPMSVIRSGSEKVLTILRQSERGQAPSLRQREGEVLQIVSKYFDFEQMSKMALGYPWKQQSPEKRREFSDLFKKLLFNTYVDRMEHYHNEKIVYDSQAINGSLAVVKTHFLSNGENIGIDYRLSLEGQQWKVYDVVVEGISYDDNYRAQISAILANNSFDTLLGMLRAKVGRDS